MSAFVVTTSNWNSAGFWSGISTSGTGQALDFSGLPSGYSVSIDHSSGAITISDGSTTFVVKDSASGVTADATMGGSTLLSHFDTIDGGTGADTLEGGDGRDKLIGGAGDDTLEGGLERDTLDGGAGNDSLSGGADSSTDIFLVSEGLDTITGSSSEAGNWSKGDYLSADNLTVDQVYTFTSVHAGSLQFGANTTTFTNITGISSYAATATNDLFDASAATAGSGSIWGVFIDDAAGGDDTVLGSALSDYVMLGSLYETQGDVVASMGDGTDTIEAYYTNSVSIDLGGGDDFSFSETATSGTVSGGTGNDTIVAVGGDHTISGGLGDDSLRTYDGDDVFVLENDFGNDTIRGGEGAGSDSDRLDFRRSPMTFTCATPRPSGDGCRSARLPLSLARLRA